MNDMNDNDYIFQGQWRIITEDLPPNAKRVMFTDKESIVIGSLTKHGDVIDFMFDRDNMIGYAPLAWMELPRIPIIIKEESEPKTN